MNLHRLDTYINSEVFKPLVFCKPLPQFGVNVYVATRVLEESPELLQAIQLAYTDTQTPSTAVANTDIQGGSTKLLRAIQLAYTDT